MLIRKEGKWINDDTNLLAEVEEWHSKKTTNDGLPFSLTQQLLPFKLDFMTFIHLHTQSCTNDVILTSSPIISPTHLLYSEFDSC